MMARPASASSGGSGGPAAAGSPPGAAGDFSKKISVFPRWQWARLVCGGCREQLEQRIGERVRKEKRSRAVIEKEERAAVLASLHGLFVVMRRHDPPEPDLRTDRPAAVPPSGPAVGEPPPKAVNRYVSACVDANGWLEVLDDERNPWHTERCNDNRCAKAHAHATDAWPVMPGQAYEAYLVRHPNPRYALGLRDHLNAWLDAELARRERGEEGGGHGSGAAGADGAGDPSASTSVTVEGFDFSAYPRDIAPQILVFEHKKVAKGDEHAEAELPEEVERFVPRGHESYGGWTLFDEMPHERCGPVREAVERLQHHLGALRYPVGTSGSPYVPEAGRCGAFDRQLTTVVARFQNHVRQSRGFLLASPETTVHELVGTEPPFVPRTVAPPTKASDSRLSWRYLIGKPLFEKDGAWIKGLGAPVREGTGEDGGTTEQENSRAPAGTEPPQSPAAVDRQLALSFGAVDALTGRLLEHWLRHGIRKAGKVMAEVARHEGDKLDDSSFLWLREEAAVRFEMWRGLVKAMGCWYGITASCGFRDVEMGRIAAPLGMASQSIHKTGLAIDLGVKGHAGVALSAASGKKVEVVDYSTPADSWPIRIECTRVYGGERAKLEARRAAAEKQLAETRQAREKLEQQRSDASAKKREEHERAIGRLREREQKLEDEVASWSYLLRDEIFETGKKDYRLRWRIYGHSKYRMTEESIQKLRQRLIEERDDFAERIDEFVRNPTAGVFYEQSLEVWDRGWRNLHNDIVESILTLDDAKLTRTYFRDTIVPFHYNPYAPDGGSDDQPLAAGEDTGVRRRLDAAADKPAPDVSRARSWLDITALGHACGLFRIGAAAKGFRAPAYDAYYLDPPQIDLPLVSEMGKPAAFGIIRGLMRALWKDNSAYENAPIWVYRSSSGAAAGLIVIPRYREDYDLDFMEQWARANGEESPWVGYLAHNYAGRLNAYLELLKSKDPFKAKLYLLEAAEPDTGLTELALGPRGIKTNLVGTLRTGPEWADILRQSGDAHRQAHKPTRTRLNTATRFILQPVFEKHTPIERQVGREWSARLEAKDGDWAAQSGPLVQEPNEEITLRRHDIVRMVAPGIGRTLEWWHYQTEAVRRRVAAEDRERDEDPEEEFIATAKSTGADPNAGPTWGKLMAEVGYSKVALGELWTPPYELAAVKNALFVPGYGYDIDKTDNNATAAPAENFWTEPILRPKT